MRHLRRILAEEGLVSRAASQPQPRATSYEKGANLRERLEGFAGEPVLMEARDRQWMLDLEGGLIDSTRGWRSTSRGPGSQPDSWSDMDPAHKQNMVATKAEDSARRTHSPETAFRKGLAAEFIGYPKAALVFFKRTDALLKRAGV